jgi:hypothetical protein
VLLAEVDPPRFDRAIARWHACFALETQGITAAESLLGLVSAQGLASDRTREVAAQTLGQLARGYGVTGVVDSLRER